MTLVTMIEKMAEGLGRTCGIFALTLVFSMPLGLIIAFLRMSKIKPVGYIARAYISVMRGTPLMLQLIAVYYGPFYLFRFSFSDKLLPIILTFSLNYASYFAEIYRGGIESIPVGQYEAASVLGYGRMRTFMRIILPQVFKRILPSVTNEVITLIKDTSMAFTIAYQEMFSIGKQLANSQSTFMPFLVAGVFYYLFNIIVAFLMSRLENAMNYYR